MRDGMAADEYIQAVVAANPGDIKLDNWARVDLNHDV
jgi:hypothetical protein